MCKQALLDALHDMQLWGIVGQSRDPSLGKGRCGSNDEYLEAYRALDGEVRCLISENEKLRKYAHSLEVANIEMASRLEDYIGQYDPTDAFVVEVRAVNARLREFAARLVEYVDPASHQDTCNIECPAYAMCYGKSTCAFPDWALEKAKELGVEVG